MRIWQLLTPPKIKPMETNKEKSKCPIRVHPYKTSDSIPLCPYGNCSHIMLPEEAICPCHAEPQVDKQQEIRDFSPRDRAIQVMKAIEVADISQWNGKNVFEASDYDAIFESIVNGVSQAIEQERTRIINKVASIRGFHLMKQDTTKDEILDSLLDLINNK